jgi:hypothetical protein
LSIDAAPTDALSNWDSFVAVQFVPKELMRSINRHSKSDIILIVPNNIYKVFMHFPLKVKDIYRLFGEYDFFLVVHLPGGAG